MYISIQISVVLMAKSDLLGVVCGNSLPGGELAYYFYCCSIFYKAITILFCKQLGLVDSQSCHYSEI